MNVNKQISDGDYNGASDYEDEDDNDYNTGETDVDDVELM